MFCFTILTFDLKGVAHVALLFESLGDAPSESASEVVTTSLGLVCLGDAPGETLSAVPFSVMIILSLGEGVGLEDFGVREDFGVGGAGAFFVVRLLGGATIPPSLDGDGVFALAPPGGGGRLGAGLFFLIVFLFTYISFKIC